MPNYSKWSIRRLRNLLIELQSGGLAVKDMQIILDIETLIREKQNA
jgi:hypothetical protein